MGTVDASSAQHVPTTRQSFEWRSRSRWCDGTTREASLDLSYRKATVNLLATASPTLLPRGEFSGWIFRSAGTHGAWIRCLLSVWYCRLIATQDLRLPCMLELHLTVSYSLIFPLPPLRSPGSAHCIRESRSRLCQWPILPAWVSFVWARPQAR